MATTATTVRERPILFSAPMVRALLEGRKTQTRRVVKPQPRPSEHHEGVWLLCRGRGKYDTNQRLREVFDRETGKLVSAEKYTVPVAEWLVERCPFGPVGRRLWVREAWAIRDCGRRVSLAPEAWPQGWPVDRLQYLATDAAPAKTPKGKPYWWNSRAPIHMPRWASRITLEVTGVRVERVNEISEADAIAEGVEWFDASAGQFPNIEAGTRVYRNYMADHWPRGGVLDASVSFLSLWESIHEPQGHHARDPWPWVWVVSFKRL